MTKKINGMLCILTDEIPLNGLWGRKLNDVEHARLRAAGYECDRISTRVSQIGDAWTGALYQYHPAGRGRYRRMEGLDILVRES